MRAYDAHWNAPFYASCRFPDVDPRSYPVLQSTFKVERQASIPIEQHFTLARLL
jgi:hypothetical protein